MDNKDLDNPQESNTIVYTLRWNKTKSARLKLTRGASFEEIAYSNLLFIRKNPGHEGQLMLLYEYRGYTWSVPAVVEEKGLFLKTLYRSSKYHKLIKKGFIK